MRLSQTEIALLKNSLKSLSPQAKLYLFGSRVDDNKRGGDIDLLILDDTLTKKDLRRLRIEFFKAFGEQKLDIVLDTNRVEKPFTHYILDKAVLL
ncbi:MAG: nucleotidyltransferase domain-containing protein [Epsilonproteobacteria bacterium]|nr:nucleotidyltransferase domain-containing protein [Campylobacterota bacterium]